MFPYRVLEGIIYPWGVAGAEQGGAANTKDMRSDPPR